MTTNKPMVSEINCETGEEIQREMTDEEYAQHLADKDAYAIQVSQWEAEKQAKAETKASALAKLAALGLTEEEANAIIGS